MAVRGVRCQLAFALVGPLVLLQLLLADNAVHGSGFGRCPKYPSMPKFNMTRVCLCAVLCMFVDIYSVRFVGVDFPYGLLFKSFKSTAISCDPQKVRNYTLITREFVYVYSELCLDSIGRYTINSQCG